MAYQQPLCKLPLSIETNKDRIKRQAKYTAKISPCLVCGDKARIINYGALSCASCKTFFRRRSLHIEKIEPCRFNGNCEITLQTRILCSACRLAKCLAIGMSSDFIRKSSFPLYTLDLLNTDRSNLSSIDWTLFSNLIHAYDIFSPAINTRNEIARQSKLLPKIRVKFAQELISNLVISFYTSLQSYIKCTNEFQMFTIAEQKCIYQRNFHSISSLTGQLILRESGLIENRTYLFAFTSLYDSETLKQARSIMKRLDYDSILIKIFLVIISFSSNCFLIYNSENIHEDYMLKKTKHLFLYQNLYAELLWKYMIFRYGYKEAVFRFVGLIKQLLDLIPLAIDAYFQNTINQTIVNKIAEQELKLKT